MPFTGNISRSRGAEQPGRITKLPPSKPHQCPFKQQVQIILSYQQPPWEKSVVHPSRALFESNVWLPQVVSDCLQPCLCSRRRVSPTGKKTLPGSLEGDMLQAGTALMVCKQGTHILRGPRSPALPDSRQGCVSEAISYPTFNSGCSTVVFSSRAHKYSLGDSKKTNKQTKTVSVKENSLEAPSMSTPFL